MSTSIFGPDVSHYQGAIDMAALRAASNDFLIAKATEGTSYRDPSYSQYREDAHAQGFLFGAYHFARPGDPVAQANYYGAVAALGPGELPVLDMEDQAIGDAAAWSLPWAKRIVDGWGVAPGIYLNTWFLNSFDWQPLVDLGCWLWWAKYDGDRTGASMSGKWPFVAMKQYTDAASAPGIAGKVDGDVFFGSVEQLQKMTLGGGQPAPTPPPPPQPVVVQHPAVFAWNLRSGNFYGNIAGPARCHGGATPAERVFVKNIQQWLIYHGCVPNVAPSAWATSGWADGRWEGATDQAITIWHQRFYQQPYPTQCWQDDYRILVRP